MASAVSPPLRGWRRRLGREEYRTGAGSVRYHAAYNSTGVLRESGDLLRRRALQQRLEVEDEDDRAVAGERRAGHARGADVGEGFDDDVFAPDVVVDREHERRVPDLHEHAVTRRRIGVPAEE